MGKKDKKKTIPSIVATEGTMGGRPRLNGTRLDLAWYVANRNQPRAWFDESWPYLTDADHALFEAVVYEVIGALEDEGAASGGHDAARLHRLQSVNSVAKHG